ncbi:triacylglycerol esterase/lipase [Vibrio phage 2.275.O._10N.286.54.E11]|nr:triacylglycerol esterase/lipase [Vibrio phage 2.275.O._10N.286.54.E11]
MKHVVLVHGLFMHGTVMKVMESRFSKLGYIVHNFSYNSFNPDAAVDKLRQYCDLIDLHGNVYFVGHSLGGIVIDKFMETSYDRYMFNDCCVVTLGTPHKGSSIANRVDSIPILRCVLGKSAPVLTAGTSSKNYDLGCIAGTCEVGIAVFSKEPNDGTVTVAEAITPFSIDSLEINLSHTALVYSNKVVEQVHYFINNRKFKK